jgi:hypothetical protein
LGGIEMWFDNRQISEIKPEEIVDLVNRKIVEDQCLEFKQEPYRLLKNSDSKDREEQKTELCKDVASIANAEGGYIIIGIKEENKIAKDFINVKNADSICESITQLCLQYIEPHVISLEVRAFEFDWKGNQCNIIIIHIPSNSEKPHGIKRNNTTFFVKRYGAHIREMPVPEITSNSKGNILDDIERIERIKSQISTQDNALEQRLVETLIYLMKLRFQKNFPDIPYYRIIAVPENLDPNLISAKLNNIINIFRNPPNIRVNGFGFQGVYEILTTPEGRIIKGNVRQQEVILLMNGFIELRYPLLNRHFQWQIDKVIPNIKNPWLYPYAVCEYPVSFLRLIKSIYSEIGINYKIHIQQEYWHIDDFILVSGHPGNLFFGAFVEDQHKYHLEPDQTAVAKKVVDPDFNPDHIAYDLVKEIYSYYRFEESSIPLFDENHNFTP